jgi:hypothetical protein
VGIQGPVHPTFPRVNDSRRRSFPEATLGAECFITNDATPPRHISGGSLLIQPPEPLIFGLSFGFA